MEIAKLVLEYWKASVWPLVFVIAVFVFRDQIRDALRRARAIDAMGVNVELAERAEEVQEALDEVQEEVTSLPKRAGEERPDRAAMSAETTASVTKALQAVRGVQQSLPRRLTATPDVERLRLALQGTALAFDRARWGHGLAAWLANETGISGWLLFADLSHELLVMADGSASKVEKALVDGLARGALRQLVSLLEESVGVSSDEATS